MFVYQLGICYNKTPVWAHSVNTILHNVLYAPLTVSRVHNKKKVMTEATQFDCSKPEIQKSLGREKLHKKQLTRDETHPTSNGVVLKSRSFSFAFSVKCRQKSNKWECRMIQIHTGEFSGNNRGMNCQNKKDYVVLGFINVLKGRPNFPIHLSFFELCQDYLSPSFKSK